MKLIIGLGNPDKKHEGTRHNLGFIVVNKFMEDYEPVKKSVWRDSEKLKSKIVSLEWKPKEGPLEKVILALPQTYMNNSGMGVSLVANYYKIAPEDIWIVHDELDLPVGAMRIRFGGAAAGHRGVESVIEALGTDKFWRFRLGIGVEHPHSGREAREGGKTPKIGKQFFGSVENYVLSPFDQQEHNKVRELIKHASGAIGYALEKGLEKSMNRYNTK